MHVQNLFLVLLDQVTDFDVGWKQLIRMQSVVRLQCLLHLREGVHLAGEGRLVVLGVGELGRD